MGVNDCACQGISSYSEERWRAVIHERAGIEDMAVCSICPSRSPNALVRLYLVDPASAPRKMTVRRGYSSIGRAPRLQRGGYGFEPR
jgi:hypothetical protein